MHGIYGLRVNHFRPPLKSADTLTPPSSLDSIAKKIGPIRIDVLGKISEAVVEGLNYLYNVHRILHRDVKPSNILVNSRGSIKLCDFGVSGELINSIADTFVGTSTYMSPERIKGAKYSVKSDVWSLGLSLLELAIGRFPFDADGTSAGTRASAGPMGILDLLQKIVNEPAPKLPKNKAFPPSLEKMIEHCLIKDPEKRPSPQELLEESFMRAAKSTNVDLEAWAHTILDKPLNRPSRSSQMISPAPAHRESPAPPRSSIHEASLPPAPRRPSASDRSGERADRERDRSDRGHESRASRDYPARTSSRVSSRDGGSPHPHSRSGSRHVLQKSLTEPVGVPLDRRDPQQQQQQQQQGYVQGTIGIGFEGMQISGAGPQPEMKERRKAPSGVMSTGSGLAFTGRPSETPSAGVEGWDNRKRGV